MKTKHIIAFGLLGLLPLAAIAGGRATLVAGKTGGRDTVKLAWRDTHTLRMGTNQNADYMLMTGGKAYSVHKEGGKTRVMDMSSMMDMMRGMGRSQNKQQKFDFMKPGSIDDTGKTETVAGVEGEVYHMTWTDKDGKHREADMVLTDDDTVVEMTHAYMNSIGAMFGDDKATHGFGDALPDDAQGVLRVGDQYLVKSISDDTPPASEFELPAEPMDLRQMMMQGR